MQIMSNAVQLSHLLIKETIKNANIIVDATAGNGSDTLFLMQTAPKNSRIYAFDIQQAALEKAQLKINQYRTADAAEIQFIHDSHAKIDEYIPFKIDLAIFNLGYLPGGDHTITTRCDSTLKALCCLQKKLAVHGHIALVVYPGHPEGQKEASAVRRFACSLDKRLYTSGWYEMVNHGTNAPALCWIEKVGEDIEIRKTRKN